MIYVDKIENRITFKIKTGYYFERLMPETMKLLATNKSKINKDKSGENMPNLETRKVVLRHCNIVNNGYWQNWRYLYTFVPNKSLGQLLDFSPTNIIFLKTLNSEFSYTEVWFIDQNSKLLEIEHKINITIAIN